MQPKRILWAIDALDSLPAMQSDLTRALRELVGNDGVAIEPFCLMARNEIQWVNDPKEDEVPFLIPADLEGSLRKWLDGVELPGLLQPTILTVDTVVPAAAARLILEHARRTGASLIALSTHARTGVDRWLLGSFTETLICESDIPVFVVNPRACSLRTYEKILVPSDFSEASRAAFDEALDLACRHQSEVVVLHEASFGVSALPMPWSAGPDEAARAEKEALVWSEAAEKRGVRMSFRLGGRVETGAAIVDFARKLGAGLIVMASQKTAARAALFGSVARDVARNADCPVLAWHPRLPSASRAAR